MQKTLSKSSAALHVERHVLEEGAFLGPKSFTDQVVIEEPLEIRLEYGEGESRIKKSVSITMRTPGEDAALAAGFLFTEGIIESPEQILKIEACGPHTGVHGGQNIVRVHLKNGIVPEISKLERNFYTTSSCGVCGKSSLDAVAAKGLQKIPRDSFAINPSLIHRLPEILRASQAAFASTGGIHAAALVSPEGVLRVTHEDVGRHNAVDKVIGEEFLRGRTRMDDLMIVVSGRAGFELVQKSLVAGIPALLAIGAPSSLSVALAEEFDMTLVGFMRDMRFNVYAGGWRIIS